MKLVHPEYNLDLELKENEVNVLVIENHTILTEAVQDLYRQCNNMEGKFVLSDDNKILQISKSINLITDAFSLNCNEKKIISQLYREVEGLAVENMVQESVELNSAILGYLEKMCEQVPYHLDYQPQVLPSAIMKMADLKFETEAVNLLERIVEYLGIVNQISQYALNIFINIKLFLTAEEIQSLYEYVFYNKIPILLIEGVTGERNPAEKLTIIDMDKCTITI